VVTLRVLGIGRAIAAGVTTSHPQSRLRAGAHRVRWGARWVRAHIYERTALRADRPVRGPAVLVEFSGTTFVPPGWRARVHRTGHLVLTHAR